MAEYKWWEKTVEYNFIIEGVSTKQISAITPFDGKTEKIGDAIAAMGLKFLMIEFKKELSGFDSEYDKYSGGKNGFSLAQACLAKDSGHHLLAYGEVDLDGETPVLLVKLCEYFSHPQIRCNLEHAFSKAVVKKKLDAYLARFLRFKDKDGDAGGGNGPPPQVNVVESMVLGVNENGQTIMMSLPEYKSLAFTPAPGSPSQASSPTPVMPPPTPQFTVPSGVNVKPGKPRRR